MSPISMKLVATGKPAQSVQPGLNSGDTVLVTLGFDKPGSGRQSVSHKFNAAGQEIDANGQVVSKGKTLSFPAQAAQSSAKAPEMDMDEIKRLIAEGNITGAQQLQAKFATEYQQWAGQNTSLSGPDLVASTVYDFLAKEYNVSEHDHDGPVLPRSKVIARAVQNGTGTMYLVQLAPSWG